MLKHLNIDEMVALSAPWVTDASRKALFLSIGEIAHLHPKVVQIHGELLRARPSEAVSPALKKVTAASDLADVRHDVLARSVSAGIDADRAHSLAEDPPDAARAAQAEAVGAKLFPDGLNIVNASYLAESGNTARVAALLKDEPAVGAFLKAIPLRGKTHLLDTTERWVAAGAQLAKLEREREALEAAETARPLGKAALSTLRSRWIRLATQVQSNLELSDAPAEAIETIRAPLLRASDRAAKRYPGEASDAAAADDKSAGGGATG